MNIISIIVILLDTIVLAVILSIGFYGFLFFCGDDLVVLHQQTGIAIAISIDHLKT